MIQLTEEDFVDFLNTNLGKNMYIFLFQKVQCKINYNTFFQKNCKIPLRIRVVNKNFVTVISQNLDRQPAIFFRIVIYAKKYVFSKF